MSIYPTSTNNFVVFEVAADSTIPGSYTLIDGMWLTDEGAFNLELGESFAEVVKELKKEFPDTKYALVSLDEFGEKGEIIDLGQEVSNLIYTENGILSR